MNCLNSQSNSIPNFNGTLAISKRINRAGVKESYNVITRNYQDSKIEKKTQNLMSKAIANYDNHYLLPSKNAKNYLIWLKNYLKLKNFGKLFDTNEINSILKIETPNANTYNISVADKLELSFIK